MPQTKDGWRALQTVVTDEEASMLLEAAAVRDIPTGAFLRLVLVGALRRGTIDSLIDRSGVDLSTVQRRRQRARRGDWRRRDDGSYVAGDWVLAIPEPRGTRSHALLPEHHWWLFNPRRGFEPTKLAANFRDAQRLALEIIERHSD